MFLSILIGISFGLIALTTALGNLVVLLAFYCDNKLRTINGEPTTPATQRMRPICASSDYFIMNMAVADFLVGFFCIPFYIPFRFVSFSLAAHCHHRAISSV
jgi:histamine receptor H3